MQSLNVIRHLSLKCSPGAAHIHTCAAFCAGKRWREMNNMCRPGREDGPTVDGLDWTYVDGREPILNVGRIKRAQEQIQICKTIMRLTKEVDTIVADYENGVEEAKLEKQRKLDSRLKRSTLLDKSQQN
ncbi:hypothetical protein CHUAL_011489 [Chamberlinius hualienensis]